MKNLLYILIIWVGFTGCLTVKQIEKNCDKFAKVCITETVTETIYRDTTIVLTDTIAVILPADTVTIRDTVTIINGLAYLPTIYREFGLVWVSAGVNANVLNVIGGLTDSTLLTPIRDTVTLERVIKETSTENTVTLPPEKYKTRFTKICMWWFVISVLAAALFILSKIYQAKFNVLLNKLKDIT